ncbi:hypothetical protein PR048_023392 [Dryococelus australis]|uniref:DDE Tnp4 domain-containing protein n=1 Tax=Dryococelus australis TaxID=614101 RepID=A0ABQ9GTZ9_9NEOP|nr:hypothetical protein PR048_023392 [Dryococelus australis]
MKFLFHAGTIYSRGMATLYMKKCGISLIAWELWMVNIWYCVPHLTVAGDFSVVFFTVVDSDYNILFAYCGTRGRISGGGAVKHYRFYKELMGGTLYIPKYAPLMEDAVEMPYMFLANEVFPLHTHIGPVERTFNFRLSRARRIVENVFGIASAIFRVLRKPMLLQPETIVNTVAYLHNFLRRNNTFRNLYTPPGNFDHEDDDGEFVQGTGWPARTRKSSSVFISYGAGHVSRRFVHFTVFY